MKNFTKILCVLLAVAVAFTAASCTLSKQYAYQSDDIELPVGVYIYYLMSAYNQAQTLAQQSDLYDSETGKYDGKKSFLKMEITDEDDVTAVAEDWIKDKAAELTKEAVAIYTKFNALGCTLDEAQTESAKTYYQSYWDQSYSDQFEPYGISFDSFFQAAYIVSVMESDAFEAEYAADGPSAVSDEELKTFFTENYVSYKYFSVNLYKEAEEEVTVEDGSEETAAESAALSEEEIAAYQTAFDAYAATLSKGGSFDDVVTEYMDAYSVTDDPRTESVEVIADDETDEIKLTVKDMKDGEAVVKTIGDSDDTKQMYLIYREPIANQVEAYSDPDQNRSTVISEMKHDAFHELIDALIEELNITLLSACNSYQPSMFEK